MYAAALYVYGSSSISFIVASHLTVALIEVFSAVEALLDVSSNHKYTVYFVDVVFKGILTASKYDSPEDVPPSVPSDILAEPSNTAYFRALLLLRLALILDISRYI